MPRAPKEHPAEITPDTGPRARSSSVLGGGGLQAVGGILLVFALAWGALHWLTKPYDGVHASPPPGPLEVTPYAPVPEMVGPAVQPPPWDAVGPPSSVETEANPREASVTAEDAE
jgi:hypothetical protein